MTLDLEDWNTKQLMYRLWATTSYAEYCELWVCLRLDVSYFPLDLGRRAPLLTTADIGERHPLYSSFVIARDPTAGSGCRWIASYGKGN
jgi:hypothetical protein